MPYSIYIFVAFAGTAIPILGTMIVSIYLSIDNVIHVLLSMGGKW
jgi:hypothetical protein